MRKILNNYVQIEPVPHEAFMSTQQESYDEVGIVVAHDLDMIDVPIGSRVYFDSYMAKKYPDPSDKDKYNWYVHHDEIVCVEDDK